MSDLMKSIGFRAEALGWDAYQGLFRSMGLERASDYGAKLLRTLGPKVSVHHVARVNMQIAFPEASERELDGLLDAYDDLLLALGKHGVEWVELNEPQLTQPLSPVLVAACERSYNRLQRTALRRLLAVSGGPLVDNLGLACSLPVDALQIELHDAERELVAALDRLPAYKALSLVLPQPEQSAALAAQLRSVHQRLGDRLWLAASDEGELAHWAVEIGNPSSIAA